MRVAARDRRRGRLPERGRERLCAGARAPPRAPPATRQRIALNVLPGVTVVPPGDLAPAGADCYRVFTPYWRRWQPRAAPRARGGAAADRACPSGSRAGRLPALADLARGAPSPELPRRRRVGGATPRDALARARPRALRPPARRPRRRRHLAARRVPALRLPLAARAGRARDGPRGRRAVRAPALLARLLRAAARGAPRDLARRLPPARPPLARRRGCARGVEGGPHRAIPIIDAGMRQLAREGFMHNRARLLTALLPDEGSRASTGASARRTSPTCSSTATSPATAATGNGSPARASTRGRTASSTRSRRPGASTRTATTCAATCPSSRASRAARCTSRGSSRSGRRAIPSRSSTTARQWRDCGSCKAYSGA